MAADALIPFNAISLPLIFLPLTNTSWPNDTIWQQAIKTVVEIMACSLTATSHHQKQC